MLEDFKSLSPDERIRHAEILERYIKSLNTGASDRRNRWYAVKNFYEYYGLELPKLSRPRMSRLFALSDADVRRAMQLKPLELEEVRKLV
ncbi:hypothetical protein DRO64_04540 [Candidatus Bathyarchaeota archaeon]|nr:MAG: hypothetical protein DRO64_04540 [Candidatus Bathyarchaeota archaeon]